MPNSLSIKKLDQLGKVVSGGTPSTIKPEYWGADIPWITPKDLSSHQGKYISKGERSITTEGLNRSSATLVPKGTVLFSSRAPIGYVAIASNELTTNQGFKNIVPYEHTDTQFLFYLLKNNIELIKSQANGSTFIEVSANVFKNIEVQVPDYSNQLIIGEILSSFDDKIEINNKINSTLEELAQTLYKRWFVDFEFPNEKGKPYKSSGGEMVESELGLIPKGFETTSLSSIADFLNGVIIKKYPEIPGEDSIPVIKIRELGRGNIDLDSDRCSKLVPDKFLIANGDIVFSWSGTLIIDIWTGEDAVLNQHLFKVTSASYPKWFYYLATCMQLENFKNIARSMATTLGHIKRSDLDNTRVAVPTSELIEQAHKILAPIIDQIISFRIQNNILKSVRDLLLPKLMSGEIEV